MELAGIKGRKREREREREKEGQAHRKKRDRIFGCVFPKDCIQSQ